MTSKTEMRMGEGDAKTLQFAFDGSSMNPALELKMKVRSCKSYMFCVRETIDFMVYVRTKVQVSVGTWNTWI